MKTRFQYTVDADTITNTGQAAEPGASQPSISDPCNKLQQTVDQGFTLATEMLCSQTSVHDELISDTQLVSSGPAADTDVLELDSDDSNSAGVCRILDYIPQRCLNPSVHQDPVINISKPTLDEDGDLDVCRRQTPKADIIAIGGVYLIAINNIACENILRNFVNNDFIDYSKIMKCI